MIPDAILTNDLAIAAGIAAAAALVKGFAGFGGAMVLAPLLALLWGPIDAIVTMLMLETVASIQLFPNAMRKTEWQLVGPLAVLTLLFTPIGLYVLLSVDGDTMRRIIGGLVVAFTALMISGWRYAGSVGPLATGAVGAGAGLLTGATGLAGPPIILFIMARAGRSHDANRAGLISYFAIINVLMIFVFAWRGLVDEATLWRVALLAPMYWIVTWIGSRFYGIASERMVRGLTYALLLTAGTLALLR